MYRPQKEWWGAGLMCLWPPLWQRCVPRHPSLCSEAHQRRCGLSRPDQKQSSQTSTDPIGARTPAMTKRKWQAVSQTARWHMDLFTMCWSTAPIGAPELITPQSKEGTWGNVFNHTEIKGSDEKIKKNKSSLIHFINVEALKNDACVQKNENGAGNRLIFSFWIDPYCVPASAERSNETQLKIETYSYMSLFVPSARRSNFLAASYRRSLISLRWLIVEQASERFYWRGRCFAPLSNKVN